MEIILEDVLQRKREQMVKKKFSNTGLKKIFQNVRKPNFMC